MKNSIKLIVVAILLAAPVFSLSFEADREKSADRVAVRQSSKKLYLNNCARCHGADGKSDTELGRLNDAPDISGGRSRRSSSAKLTRLITSGRGSMPGFGKKLTKAQIGELVGYVRGL